MVNYHVPHTTQPIFHTSSMRRTTPTNLQLATLWPALIASLHRRLLQRRLANWPAATPHDVNNFAHKRERRLKLRIGPLWGAGQVTFRAEAKVKYAVQNSPTMLKRHVPRDSITASQSYFNM